MPQWRKLHSKITESLDVNDMPDDFTRLLWVLLPTQLCREGRGVDNPSWVRSRVFPMREDVTVKMVSAALEWFELRGMIVRYQVAGRGYFHVPTFHHYQGNTEREAQSEYPAPPDDCTTDARPTHDLLMSKSVSDVDVDVDSDSDSDADVDARAAAAARNHNGYAKVLSDHGIILNGQVQADMWRELAEQAGDTLFKQALDEAARASPRVPSLKYVDAIVKRCLTEGTAPGDRRPGNGSRTTGGLADFDAMIAQFTEGGSSGEH